MRVCIINTGGTIACAGDPLAPMPSARFAEAAGRLLTPSLMAAMPDLRLHFDTGLAFDSPSGTLDSTDLRPVDWCRIAGRILDLYADHDGFVVLHGTDTMDYTASALPFLLNVFDPDGLGRAVLSKPVVLTGAQLPLFRETAAGPVLNAGGDGWANVTGAVQTARLRLPEVALFFDGRLWRGNRALKVSTTRFAAFDSPHLAPLAESGIGVRHGPAVPLNGPPAPDRALDDPAAMALARDQLDAVEAGLGENVVIELPVTPADHASPAPPLAALIDAALAAGARGLVLTGYGEGNVPAGAGGIASALQRAVDGGVTVMIGSRVIGGSVGTFHYAAGAWMARTGAVAAGDMTPVAAFAKLSILLAAAAHHGWDGRAIRALLSRSLTGESSSRDRLSGGEVLHPGMALHAADGGAVLDNDPADGLTLRDGAGAQVWAVPGPGRLVLRDRPVFLGHDGATLWAAPADLPGGILILTGHPVPALTLHDPAGRAAPAVIAGL